MRIVEPPHEMRPCKLDIFQGVALELFGDAAVSLSPKSTDAVRNTVREASIRVVGEQDLGNGAHACAFVQLLKAFGDSASGSLYVEPTTRFQSNRSADLVVCPPKLGILVVEVKGWKSNTIDHIEAGNFFLRRDGPMAQVA